MKIMSKWIDENLFNQFVEQKTHEADKTPAGPRRSEIVWKTPERGTPDKPKVYEGRFLPDQKGNFYKNYYYHMFYSGEKWNFLLCDKTFTLENFCPWCSVTSKLYMGNSEDKKRAAEYKRKEKFVSNFFIIDDPRDAENEEKVAGSVKIYEFPGKVESKLKSEITDTKHGLGPAIFDPSGEGFSFILKVRSTKPKDGKTWPDYSDSLFARKPSALGDDSEIQTIMDSRYDLEEYIEGMTRTEEDVITLLKAEMVYEFIEDEWKRAKHMAKMAGPVEDDIPDFDDALEPQTEERTDEELLNELPETNAEPATDEELLEELAGL